MEQPVHLVQQCARADADRRPRAVARALILTDLDGAFGVRGVALEDTPRDGGEGLLARPVPGETDRGAVALGVLVVDGRTPLRDAQRDLVAKCGNAPVIERARFLHELRKGAPAVDGLLRVMGARVRQRLVHPALVGRADVAAIFVTQAVLAGEDEGERVRKFLLR